jgi:hypothetical protein
MLPAGLHALLGDRPRFGLGINLFPHSSAYFTGTSCRQDDELESPLHTIAGATLANLLQQSPNLIMGARCMVFHRTRLGVLGQGFLELV